METVKATLYVTGDSESWWAKITFRLPKDFDKEMVGYDFDGRLDLEAVVEALWHEIMVRNARTGNISPLAWFSLGQYYLGPGGPFQHEATFRINTMNRIVIYSHGGLDI